MNLTTLLKNAKTLGKDNPNPMTDYDEKILFQIIDEARYTPNGALLIFDFTPYLQDANVNLNNVEIFIDLFIIANKLNNAYTKGSPLPKVFINYNSVSHEALGMTVTNLDVYWPYRSCPINIFENPHRIKVDVNLPYLFTNTKLSFFRTHQSISYTNLFERNAPHCHLAENADIFLKKLQKDAWEDDIDKSELPSIIEIGKMSNITNLQNRLQIAGQDIMSVELRDKLMQISDKAELLEYYFANLSLDGYTLKPEQMRPSSRYYHLCRYLLEKRYHGVLLKELPEFANNFFEVGDFVSAGGIVKDVCKVLKNGSFEYVDNEITENSSYGYVEFDKNKIQNPNLWMATNDTNDLHNTIRGIMISDCCYLKLHYASGSISLENQNIYDIPTLEQVWNIIDNKDKINASLEKLGLAPLSDYIVYCKDEYSTDMTYCCNISKPVGQKLESFLLPRKEIEEKSIKALAVQNFTNGYFFKE